MAFELARDIAAFIGAILGIVLSIKALMPSKPQIVISHVEGHLVDGELLPRRMKSDDDYKPVTFVVAALGLLNNSETKSAYIHSVSCQTEAGDELPPVDSTQFTVTTTYPANQRGHRDVLEDLPGSGFPAGHFSPDHRNWNASNPLKVEKDGYRRIVVNFYMEKTAPKSLRFVFRVHTAHQIKTAAAEFVHLESVINKNIP